MREAALYVGLSVIAGVALWPSAATEDAPAPSPSRAIERPDAPTPARLASADPARSASTEERTARRIQRPAPADVAPTTRAEPDLTAGAAASDELRYRVFLQRDDQRPIQRGLALTPTPDGHFTCRLISPAAGPGSAPAEAGADPDALLRAVVAAVSADQPGRVPLDGRGWVEGERRRTPLGQRRLGDRVLRGVRVHARAFGVDPAGRTFANVSELEVWSDVALGHPVLVMGQQRVRHGGDAEQRIDVLVEPAA